MSTPMNPVLGSPAAAPVVARGYQPTSDSHPGPERVAVIVHHGMGQQVPFETIEGVAKAIWSQLGEGLPEPVVRYVRLGVAGNGEIEPELVRAELRVSTRGDGGASRSFEVHIYESYWAPLTEGQVTIRDVIGFLIAAGWNGWMNTACGTFQRWMFGTEHKFELPKTKLMAALGGLVTLLLALVFINAVLTAAAASHAIGGSNTFPSGDMLANLTWDFLVLDLVAVAIALGISFFGSSQFRAIRTIGWALIYGGAASVCLVALWMAFHVTGFTTQPISPYLGTQSGCAWFTARGGCWLRWILRHRLAILVVWGLEIVAANRVRWALIEYVGDVTAYIAAYSVSKFWKLRQDIRDTAMKVTRAVYRAQTPAKDNFLYNKIVVVGHSLGSVIGYDVLNSLLLEAVLSDKPLRVPERTRMFLTFGSPLDKTAFLFRTLKDMRSQVREVGAAAVQPMIADYAYRPQEWVNLWSRADIISGRLDYYDQPTSENAKDKVAAKAAAALSLIHQGKPIHNKIDPAARTPLKAHVEYWGGELLARELVRGITT